MAEGPEAGVVTSPDREKTVERNTTQHMLAFLAAVIFFSVVGWIVVHGVDDMSNEALLMVGTVVGYCAKICGDVYGFYFGSSASSAKKDATIANLSKPAE